MSKVVEVIVQAVDKASKTFDDVSKSSKKLESALKSVKKYSWIAMTALAWVTTYAVKQAVQLEPVKKSFDQLTASVWQNSKEMLKSLKQASKGAVSEYDLMLSANRSLKLWVASNTEDMTDLMKIARLYGQQMWQDVTQSFNDIVTWLWRWSPMILDNLWIIIDSEKAYEEYAEKIWKSASELSKQEKTQALVNATLEEWRKKLEEYGEPAQTMWERLQSLKNNFQEMATRIGEAILPMLEKLLEKITPIIEKVADRIEQNPELAANLLLTWTAITWIVFGVSSLLPKLVSLAWVLGWPITLALTAAAWAFLLVEWYVWKVNDRTKELEDEMDLLDQQLKNWEITYEEYQKRMQAIRDEAIRLSKPLQQLKDRFLQLEVVKKVSEWRHDLNGKIQTFIDKVKTAISSLKEFVKESMSSWIGSWIVSAGVSVAKSIIKWKAVWWPVSANTPYIVGENWPELFVPSNSWTIVPNDQMWWIVVNVNFGGVAINNGSDEMSFAQTITQEITRELELYKKGIY